jgi:threonine synthase
MIAYRSTRGGVPDTALSAAILAGLAPDGGLYVPSAIPRLALRDFAGATRLPDVAARLLAPWFEGDSLAADLPAMCQAAFDFDLPLADTHDPATRVLELFHGPTAAFKDFGARFLAQCMLRLNARSEREVTVLVATSGDTGSAVAAAFHRMPGVRVVILYPDGRVSPRQAHQLGCFGDNIRAWRVAGSFDDCQRLVKQAFADDALRAARPLASANSISLGRLLPQMAYYAHAALSTAREGRPPLDLVVPTGNLGNAFAAVLARAAGLPIGRIVLATNANRVLPDFLASGEYLPTPSLATLANAMDVGNPSNAERLRWLHPDLADLRAAVAADSVDDVAIRAAIVAGESRYGMVFCPHTACGIVVRERLAAAGDTGPWCVVATAHPAKFETVVEPLLGRAVEPPPALAAMLARPAHAEPLAADYAALRAVLADG